MLCGLCCCVINIIGAYVDNISICYLCHVWLCGLSQVEILVYYHYGKYYHATNTTIPQLLIIVTSTNVGRHMRDPS